MKQKKRIIDEIVEQVKGNNPGDIERSVQINLAMVSGELDHAAANGLKLPINTLQLALVQAEVSHANILSIDTAAAERMPGVERIITFKDVKGRNRIRSIRNFPTNKGDGWERPILCDIKVFQYGDVLAIVCADTKEHAEAAAKKVTAQLEILPAYLDAQSAMERDALQIHPGIPNLHYKQELRRGQDTDLSLEGAVHSLEGSYSHRRQMYLTPKPEEGLAYLDEDENLVIHSHATDTTLQKRMIAPGIGISPERLRIVNHSSHGASGYPYNLVMEALLGVACLVTGKPVYLHHVHPPKTAAGSQPPFWMNAMIGADENGRIIVLEGDWTTDHGPYSEFGDVLTARENLYMGACYNIPNILSVGRTVTTNRAWFSPFRSCYVPQSLFASESLVDELALKMGIDPFELRLRNIIQGEEEKHAAQPCAMGNFIPLFDRLRPLYEEAMERSKKESTPEIKRGVGISLGFYRCDLELVDQSDPVVQGKEKDPPSNPVQGMKDVMASMVTSGSNNASIAYRGINSVSGLVPQRQGVSFLDLSGSSEENHRFGQNPDSQEGNRFTGDEDCPVGDSTFFTGKVPEVLNLSHTLSRSMTVAKRSAESSKREKDGDNYTYAIFMAEVAVSVRTGKTAVKHFTMVADIGKVDDRRVIDDMMLGSISQAIGLALAGDGMGKTQTEGEMGAKTDLPVAGEMAEKVSLYYAGTRDSRPAEVSPFFAELPLTSAHVAVVNAIANASGVRIRQLPVQPEQVLEGLKKRK